MENSFQQEFGSAVCDGDCIETAADHRGVYYVATIKYDLDSGRPDQRQDGFWPSRDPEAAGYVLPENFDAEQAKAERVMAAWKNDEWYYVGIVISAHVQFLGEQFCIDEHADSLWGIECNYPDSNNEYLTEVANALLVEAQAKTEKRIGELVKALTQVGVKQKS